MSFLQPLFLGFLALALIPLVLYLIFRLRRHEVAWGATYVLRLTIQQKKRQNIWKQICVLLLRTIVLALLALAFARPFLPVEAGGGKGEIPRGPERLHRVLLIDNSQSMLAAGAGRPRLDEARTAAIDMLAGLRSGDVAHLVPMAPPTKGGAIEAIPVAGGLGAEAAASAAGRVTLSAEPIDLSAAVRVAVAALRDAASPQRQLVIVSDFCRVDHPAIEGYEVLGEQLRGLNVRAAGLNLGLRDASNLALESIGSGSELFLPGQPTNLYVDVVNFGDAPSPETRAQLLLDGKPVADQVLALPPGARRTLVFPVALEPGRRRIEARVGGDALSFDDAAVAFVEARAEVSVLVVTPFDPAAEGFAREGEFLQRALESAAQTPARLKVQLLPANNLIAQDLAGRDVVILCGATELPVDVVGGLEKLVRRGGGLLIAGGPAVNAPRLNAALRSLIPAPIDAPAREQVDPERYTNPQPGDAPVILLREFEESRAGDLAAARIYNHLPIKAPDSPTTTPAAQTPPAAPATPAATRTLLSLTSGGPLLLERRVGKGVVLLWTTSLGGSWTSLPVHHAYLPLLVRCVNYAAGFAAHRRNLAPGDSFIQDVTDSQGDLFVTTPDQRLVPCAAVASAGRRSVRFEETTAPGVYELQDAAGRVLASFSVARPLHESDLRGLDAQQQHRLEQALDLKLANDAAGLRAALWRKGDGRDATAWFVLVALALVAIDALLTWSWFR